MKTLEPGLSGGRGAVRREARPSTAMRRANQRFDPTARPLSAAAQRRQRLVMRRRRMAFSFFLAALAAGLLGFLGWESDFLKVKYVEIEGVERIRDREIYEKTRNLIGANMALIRVGDVEGAIAENPQVKSVEVRRALPSRLKLIVHERVPFAYVTDQSGWYLIDREMVVMGIQKGPVEPGLLEIRCERALNPRAGRKIAFPLSDRLPDLEKAVDGEFKGQTARLEFRRSGIVLHLKSGVYVLLGPGDQLEAKLKLAPIVLSELARGGKEFVGLNLIRLETPSYIVKDD